MTRRFRRRWRRNGIRRVQIEHLLRVDAQIVRVNANQAAEKWFGREVFKVSFFKRLNQIAANPRIQFYLQECEPARLALFT